jgi:hypothetical protein
MTELAFVFSVGTGTMVEKSYWLARSIHKTNPEAEIYAFVAESEREDIYIYHLKRIEEFGGKILYGEIPLKEYKFTSKHQALIQAGEQSSAKYLVCLDSDMLVMNPFTLPEGFSMYVVPVDIGNTSWGRESARSKWEELYKLVDSPMPTQKIIPILDKHPMFPYYNGGFAVSTDHKFGQKWLDTTKVVYDKMPDREFYQNVYSKQSKKRRLFTKIPFAHWTEQVTLTLLAAKYHAKALDYRYDYPLNTLWTCPQDVRIVHYHDVRNLVKIRDLIKDIELPNIVFTYPRILNYQLLRGMKVRLGKF